MADLLVAAASPSCRKALIRALNKRAPALLARCFQLPVTHWSEVTVPAHVAGFEALSFLFACSPANRGLIRMDFDEAAALFRFTQGCRGGRGVEIGRCLGGSTLLISVALPPSGRLLSIDKYPMNDEALRHALRVVGTEERVDLVVGDANEVEYEAECDFVFIDGDHTYEGAKKDHLRWGAAVRSGGLIMHHDMAKGRPYASQRPALRRLYNDIMRRQRGELAVLAEVGSLTVFQRISTAWTVF